MHPTNNIRSSNEGMARILLYNFEKDEASLSLFGSGIETERNVIIAVACIKLWARAYLFHLTRLRWRS